MNKILIQNPRIINEGRSFIGSVLVEGDKIAAVFEVASAEGTAAAPSAVPSAVP